MDRHGAPEAARLHRASKAAGKVAVYSHRDVTSWLARIAGERIHRGEALEIHVVDRDLVSALVSRLARRMEIDMAVSERNVYVTVAEETFSGTIELRRLPSTP